MPRLGRDGHVQTCLPPPSLRGLGPARGSGSTGASPGNSGSAPNARPHWLSPPVGVASPAPARTGCALGAQRDEKALGVIVSDWPRRDEWAGPERRSAVRLADLGRGRGAQYDPASPVSGRGYSARQARWGRVRRWRRARRERARSWRCSSCTRWPPAPRGQVRTGAGRGGSGLEGSIRAARGGGRFSGAHWGAPCGVGWRDVPQGLRGALAGSPPLGWAPGRLRERQAWGEERRRGRLRRGTSAAGGAGAGGTEAPWGYRSTAGPG